MFVENDPHFVDRQVGIVFGELGVQQLRHRPGELRAGRTAADDAKRQRPLVDERRILVDRLEHFEDLVVQPDRVGHRVERKANARPRPACREN